MYKIPWGKILQGLFFRNGVADVENKLHGEQGEMGGRGTTWETGTDIYTTVCKRDNQAGLTV